MKSRDASNHWEKTVGFRFARDVLSERILCPAPVRRSSQADLADPDDRARCAPVTVAPGDGLHDNVAEGKTNKAEIQCLKKISATGKSRKRISPDLPSRRMRIAKEPQSKVVVSS